MHTDIYVYIPLYNFFVDMESMGSYGRSYQKGNSGHDYRVKFLVPSAF